MQKRARSPSEYKRLIARGVDILPPEKCLFTCESGKQCSYTVTSGSDTCWIHGKIVRDEGGWQEEKA